MRKIKISVPHFYVRWSIRISLWRAARIRKKKVNRPGVMWLTLYLCLANHPERLLANLCVCAVDASVVVRVAVVGAILVRTFVVFPVKSVYKYELTHSVPKRFRTVVYILA